MKKGKTSRTTLFTGVLLLLTLALVSSALGVVTINYWHAMSGEKLTAVNELIDKFNETHPGIKVNGQFAGGYHETVHKFIVATAAGIPPNVVMVVDTGTAKVLDTGAIIPIQDLAKPGTVDWGDYLDPALNYYKDWDGKLVFMPFNPSSTILFYNKDLFRKAGLDPNVPPTYYKDVEAMGEKIVASKAAPNAITFSWPCWALKQTFGWSNELYANNENGRIARATKILLNSPAGVKIVTAWKEWTERGIFKWAGREYKPEGAFIGQRVAMLYGTPGSITGMQIAANFDWGTSFIPRLEGTMRGGGIIGGASNAVVKGFSEEETEAAWEFVYWLSQTGNTKEFSKGTGYFAVRKSAIRDLMYEGWFKEYPDFLTGYLTILMSGDSYPARGPFYGTIASEENLLESGLERIIPGHVPVKEGLDEIAAQANKELEEYNSLYVK